MQRYAHLCEAATSSGGSGAEPDRPSRTPAIASARPGAALHAANMPGRAEDGGDALGRDDRQRRGRLEAIVEHDGGAHGQRGRQPRVQAEDVRQRHRQEHHVGVGQQRRLDRDEVLDVAQQRPVRQHRALGQRRSSRSCRG